MPMMGSLGGGSVKGFTPDSTVVATGQYLHEVNGAYQWLCPSGVTSVSVCCIGGGGGGVGFTSSTINQGGAGGGGSISYKNNVRVVPGTTYILFIATGATGTSGGAAYFGTRTTTAVGGNGGYATFGLTSSLANSLCNADGGQGGRGKTTDSSPYTAVLQGGLGGSVNSGFSFGTSTIGYGLGGQGGNGGSTAAAGGGGTGGYNASTGGRGAGIQGAAGTGGGSGAGAGGSVGAAGAQGTDGGGASILGLLPSGGNLYGQGGGAGSGVTGRVGGRGAIRIMWPGVSRQYPSITVADQPTIIVV